jgi:hypothetical protein
VREAERLDESARPVGSLEFRIHRSKRP